MSRPKDSWTSANARSEAGREDLDPLSHGAAIVLLLLYVSYFCFFFVCSPDEGFLRKGVSPASHSLAAGILHPGMLAASIQAPSLALQAARQQKEIFEEQNVKLRPSVAVLWLLVGVAGSVVSSLCLVTVIDVPSQLWGISKSFLGLVLLPALLSSADSITAICYARRQDMDWTIHATVVSNIQLSLFVLPVTICLGWILKIDGMNLYFDGYQIALVFMTVLLINHIFQGQSWRWQVASCFLKTFANVSHRVEGTMLLAMYGLLVDTAWFYPNQA